MMRFDAYAATVPAQPSLVESLMSQSLGGCWGQEKGRNSFKQGLRHESGLVLQWGGQNPLPHLHIQGDSSPLIAGLIRKHWPSSHKVSRADVCLDFDSASAWDRIYAIMVNISRELNITAQLIGAPVGLKNTGRTLYLGSPSSDVRVRLYEKGLKEIGEGRSESPNWVRLEIQVRPKKERKQRAAALEPEGFWGMAQWSRRLVSEVTDTLVPFYRRRGYAAAMRRRPFGTCSGNTALSSSGMPSSSEARRRR